MLATFVRRKSAVSAVSISAWGAAFQEHCLPAYIVTRSRHGMRELMGRRPIGELAMTPAERQQRRRAKLKEAAAKQVNRGTARAQQTARALRADLARLEAAGTFFDLLHDTPEEIARQIVNRVP